MKLKTSNLTGNALDWAVAKCEGLKLKKFEKNGPWYYAEADEVYRFIVGHTYSPSTNWSQGGPIIEREGMTLTAKTCESDWLADIGMNYECEGPTPLIAAMRCYVASELGDEIEIPEELQ